MIPFAQDALLPAQLLVNYTPFPKEQGVLKGDAPPLTIVFTYREILFRGNVKAVFVLLVFDQDTSSLLLVA